MTSATSRQIRVDFPTDVEISREAHAILVAAISQICRDWEAQNPGHVMWIFGMGALPTFNPFTIGDDEPMTFDDTVEHFEVSAREGHPGELERRERRVTAELRGPVIAAGPKLLAFTRAILAGVAKGGLIVAPGEGAEEDKAHLERVLAYGESAVALAEGRLPA